MDDLVKTSCNLRQDVTAPPAPPQAPNRETLTEIKFKIDFVLNGLINKKKRKTPCSKPVQQKYIWDLHLKVHYRVIYTPPSFIYYLYK